MQENSEVWMKKDWKSRLRENFPNPAAAGENFLEGSFGKLYPIRNIRNNVKIL